MTGVTGEPRLSGPELDDHCPENSFELMWAATADFAALNLVPGHLRTDLPSLIDGE